jgi:hypothetical protein
LLQLGWLLVGLLLTKLTATEKFPVTSIYFSGMLIMLVFWIVSSGFYDYLAALGERVRTSITRQRGPGSIGIVPPLGWTYTEELEAIKASSQAMTMAIRRINHDFAKLQNQGAVDLKMLPPHWRPRTARAAAWLGRLFALNALCWGTYQADGSTIWLNIQWFGPGTVPKDRPDSEPEDQHNPELFPAAFKIDLPPAVMLSTNDEADMYIILLATIAQRTQNRAAVPEYLTSLLISTFVSSSDEAVQPSSPPMARAVLAEIIGNWIGCQLSGHVKEANNSDVKVLDEWKKERIRHLARKCVKVDPKRAVHHYRNGAVACLMKDERAALLAFECARSCESFWTIFEDIPLMRELAKAIVEWEDTTEYQMRINQNLDWVRLPARVARAIYIVGDFAVSDLSEMMGNPNWQLWSRYYPVSAKVIEKLLTAKALNSNKSEVYI